MTDEVRDLQINMAHIEEKLNSIGNILAINSEEHKEIRGAQKEMLCKINSFIQSAEDRFADKKDHKESMEQVNKIVTTLDNKFAPIRAWTIMVWAGRAIGMAMILGLLGLIYKLIIFFGNNLHI